MKLLFFTLVTFSYLTTFSQSFNYSLNNRIDTSHAEVKEVLHLWLNYLDSKPDSIYDNPYWNNLEKEKYKRFDFTSGLMYQFPSQQLLQYFKPFILSIEKRNNLYEIRTLFYAEGLTGYAARSNPWNILRLYAKREGNEWKLQNALPILTQNWNQITVGKITYIFDCNHKFNEMLAVQANTFCDSIALIFDVTYDPFEYYITANPDELGQILGFDFSFGGIAAGLAMYEARKLFSGFGSEFYPHEFAHLVLGHQKHSMVSEGIATWIGGAGGEKTFRQNMHDLATALSANDTVSFIDVLNKQWGWQQHAFYISGALWCDLIYKRSGIKGVKKYLDEAPPDNENYLLFLTKTLGVEEKDLNQLWRKEILKYK
jgi:hypothetical protein